MVNKTTVYELLHYIYNADIILTHESGIWHCANIICGKPRYLIVPAGARQTSRMNRYRTPDVNVYWIENRDKESFTGMCYCDNEKGCMIEPLFSEVNDYVICRDNSCKYPVLKDNEMISKCMSHIAMADIEYAINDSLNKVYSRQNIWRII